MIASLELKENDRQKLHHFVISSIEKEIVTNWPDRLREWKIFVFKCLSDGIVLYNDTEIPVETFNDLIQSNSIQYEGIFKHQGEDCERYKWTPILKYPQKYYRQPKPELRKLVFIRDSYTCVNCGTDKNLSIDHIIPWSLGGKTEYENLQVLCRSCNSKKGNR